LCCVFSSKVPQTICFVLEFKSKISSPLSSGSLRRVILKIHRKRKGG
jgi:hypothetical protein